MMRMMDVLAIILIIPSSFASTHHIVSVIHDFDAE
jgi:hypothetical protein